MSGDNGWTPDAEAEFVSARDLVSAVIAAYSERIDAAGGPEQADHLRAARTPYLELRARLTIEDSAEIAKISAEFPALLARVRG
ncbi:hypothetical protein [Kribbella catacumbae]|uniref:hypothetical protein n=1 Tax=Kribbella catacumbae TaxID=460086 RepID=UPI00035FA7B0|nr:hypothetical protein [Kribbella catacumbae]